MDTNVELLLLQSAITAINGGVGYLASSLISGYLLNHKELRKYSADFKFRKFSEIADKMVEDGEISFKQIREMKNLWDIAEAADDYMRRNSGEHYEVDKLSSFDFDWFAKFVKSAADVSDKEVQEFWARILAGEFEKRGTIPLSLIHALSLMNRQNALNFLNLSRFCFRDGKKQDCVHPLVFFSKNRNAYSADGINITFTMLKDLERIGLVYCDFKDEFIFERSKRLWYGNHKLYIKSSDGIVQCGNITLSDAGQALYSIVHDKLPSKSDNIFEHTISVFMERGYEVVVDERKVNCSK